MSYRLTIKLEPYLQEYLTCKLNDPVFASGRNIIGAIIRPFLELVPKNKTPERTLGTNSFTFEIPHQDWIDNRAGTVWISPYNQKNVERILKAHFKDALFSYVDDKRRYRIMDNNGKVLRRSCIKDILLQFCSDNNITFNKVNYETLKKIYYRKTVENSALFSKKLSLSCPLIFLL